MAKKEKKNQTEGCLDIIAGRVKCPWMCDICDHYKNGYCQAERKEDGYFSECPIEIETD